MKNAGFTKQERNFIAVMRIWMVLFLLAGIIFAISPSYIPKYVTNIGLGIFNWEAPPPESLTSSNFWVVLSVSLLFSLSYICAIIQRSPVRNIGYTRPVIFAKFVTSVGFLICFIQSSFQFLYLVSTIVDGLIFIITFLVYRSAVRSRT